MGSVPGTGLEVSSGVTDLGSSDGMGVLGVDDVGKDSSSVVADRLNGLGGEVSSPGGSDGVSVMGMVGATEGETVSNSEGSGVGGEGRGDEGRVGPDSGSLPQVVEPGLSLKDGSSVSNLGSSNGVGILGIDDMREVSTDVVADRFNGVSGKVGSPGGRDGVSVMGMVGSTEGETVSDGERSGDGSSSNVGGVGSDDGVGSESVDKGSGGAGVASVREEERPLLEGMDESGPSVGSVESAGEGVGGVDGGSGVDGVKSGGGYDSGGGMGDDGAGSNDGGGSSDNGMRDGSSNMDGSSGDGGTGGQVGGSDSETVMGVGNVSGALDESVGINVGVTSLGDTVGGPSLVLGGRAAGVAVGVLRLLRTPFHPILMDRTERQNTMKEARRRWM
jgi:hypothetical protein